MNEDLDQLGELLRDVTVPSDLKRRLKAIAQTSPDASFKVPSETRSESRSEVPQVTLVEANREDWAEESNCVSRVTCIDHDILYRTRPGSDGGRPWHSRKLVSVAVAAILLVASGAVLWTNTQTASNRGANYVGQLNQEAEQNPGRISYTDEAVGSIKGSGSESPEALLAALAEIEQAIQQLRRQEELLEARWLERPMENPSSLGLTEVEAKAVDRISQILVVAAETALKVGASPKVVRADLEQVIERFPDSAGASSAKDILARMN